MSSSDVLYREASLFSNGAIWLIVICLTFCSVYFGLPPIFSTFGDKSPPSAVIWGSSSFIAVGFALPILLLLVKMRIQVRQDGLYVKVLPFHLSFKKISLDGLQRCEPYAPKEKEENKLGLGKALTKKAYSLGGRRGIRLDFKDGRTIFVESRRPEKITQAIRTSTGA